MPSDTESANEFNYYHSDEDEANSTSSHATDVEASTTNKKGKKYRFFMSRKAKKKLAVQHAEQRVKDEQAVLDAKREEWVG